MTEIGAWRYPEGRSLGGQWTLYKTGFGFQTRKEGREGWKEKDRKEEREEKKERKTEVMGSINAPIQENCVYIRFTPGSCLALFLQKTFLFIKSQNCFLFGANFQPACVLMSQHFGNLVLPHGSESKLSVPLVLPSPGFPSVRNLIYAEVLQRDRQLSVRRICREQPSSPPPHLIATACQPVGQS